MQNDPFEGGGGISWMNNRVMILVRGKGEGRGEEDERWIGNERDRLLVLGVLIEAVGMDVIMMS